MPPAGCPVSFVGLLEDLQFSDIRPVSRVVVFAPEVAASYFAQCGRSAALDGAISNSELHDWNAGIQELS